VATKQLGNLTVAEFDTTDISGTYTTFEISGEAPEKEQVDVSDKSSWAAGEIETIDGLAGQPKTTVTVTINDEADGASNAYTLAENDTGTLVIYPEGKTPGKPARTLIIARDALESVRASFLAACAAASAPNDMERDIGPSTEYAIYGELGYVQTHAWGRRLANPIRHPGLFFARDALESVRASFLAACAAAMQRLGR